MMIVAEQTNFKTFYARRAHIYSPGGEGRGRIFSPPNRTNELIPPSFSLGTPEVLMVLKSLLRCSPFQE
jgi:hypothetical protein